MASTNPTEEFVPPFLIPWSKFTEFVHVDKTVRYGQAFYKWAKLEKLTEPAAQSFAQEIYNATDHSARNLVQVVLDWRC